MVSSSTALAVAKYLLGATVTGTALVTGGLWYYQRSLIYPAYLPDGSRTNVPRPTTLGMAYEDITLTTSDNVKIKAYMIPARKNVLSKSEMMSMSATQREEAGEKAMAEWNKKKSDDDALEYAKGRPTVVIFHANAGNMGHRVPLARKFHADFGCNVFMLSYRGYGESEGHASEKGIRTDVEAALEYITNHPILGSTRLILYGQSIGGAVCLWAGANFPDLVSGIIIENTFYSLESLVPCILPQIPKFILPVLLTERWDSHTAMEKVSAKMPMLMISGTRDELVPPAQMELLRKLRESKGGRVRWKIVDGGHNDTCVGKGYWEEVEAWLLQEFAM